LLQCVVAVCCCNVSHYVAGCCRVLQYVAVCCSVLQCVAVLHMVQCVAVCCSVERTQSLVPSLETATSECYSVLQCVAVCCSACCRVLQCVIPILGTAIGWL